MILIHTIESNPWSWAHAIQAQIEEWPGYAIGSDGRAYSSFLRGPGAKLGNGWKVLKNNVDIRGYLRVDLTKSGRVKHKLIHHLVLETFVGPKPSGMWCCHKNGLKTDNRLDNLRWDTPKSNSADSIRHGTFARGSKNGRSKFAEDDVVEIRRLLMEGLSQSEVARRFDVTPGTIWLIEHGKHWRHVL